METFARYFYAMKPLPQWITNNSPVSTTWPAKGVPLCSLYYHISLMHEHLKKKKKKSLHIYIYIYAHVINISHSDKPCSKFKLIYYMIDLIICHFLHLSTSRINNYSISSVTTHSCIVSDQGPIEGSISFTKSRQSLHTFHKTHILLSDYFS